MVAPSLSLAMAASAEAMRLSMVVCESDDAAGSPEEECTASRCGVVAEQLAVNRSGGHPPFFGCVASKGLVRKRVWMCGKYRGYGHISRMCGRERSYGPYEFTGENGRNEVSSN